MKTFLLSFAVLSTILFIGTGVSGFGESEVISGIRAYFEFRSHRIPAEPVVPPFIFISSILLAWLDSRRMERKRAAEMRSNPGGTV